jgi:hypothetical protein
VSHRTGCGWGDTTLCSEQRFVIGPLIVASLINFRRS